MAVRLKDVAAAARVSITLVSNYVNGKSTTRMSASTRERIDKALRELDYRPNPLARLLRTGDKKRTVGIITAGLTNEVNLQTVLAFQQHLLERDYNSLIYYTRNELGLLRTGCQEMLCRGCAGVIVHKRGMLGVVVTELQCDYYDCLNQKLDFATAYFGEYMSQYSFAEYTNAQLYARFPKNAKKNKKN
jgi:DNA-binding LacI/PurR family transcriptional regulator